MLNQALLITESTFGAESEECLKVCMYVYNYQFLL